MNVILGATNAVRMILGRVGQLARAFVFDASKVTFTAGMAKRNGGGPFAAGMVAQGKWDASGGYDVVTFPRGTAIADYFYPTIDQYQGSIVLWVTPEWNGNDGKQHNLFGDGAQWYVIKTATNQLWVNINNSIFINYGSVAWTAGTTYCIVVRWDTRNTLDGTNYGCVSVNDVHVFGDTSPAAPSATFPSWSLGTTADAIIEGLTIYRRPLFDGAYGVDAGNGDELNLIYNGGTGKDPTEITGSWDVVFCLPTNATPGALVTGTGEAWSHPHGSEVLVDAFCQRAYAASAWSDVGSPVACRSVEFNGSSTGIDCGSEASADDLHDNTFTVEAWIRPDVVSGSYVVVGKETTSTGAVGWRLGVQSGKAYGIVACATTDAATLQGSLSAGAWVHLAMNFNDAGDRKVYLAVNGIWQSADTAGVGAIASDAASALCIGTQAGSLKLLDGGMGWVRISNNARYTPGTNFTPPSRTSPPAVDANTVRLFRMDEGAGTTITDYSANAQNGTLSNGSWNSSRNLDASAGEKIYAWGYEFGADAANEGISQTKTSLAAGSNFVIRPVLHYDANAQPIIKVLDATNGDAVITSLTCPDQTANLVVNGGFDSDTSGWTVSNATLASVLGGVSGNCVEVTRIGASSMAYQIIQLVPLATYQFSYWSKAGTSTSVGMKVGIAANDPSLYTASVQGDLNWTQRTGSFRAPANGLVYITMKLDLEGKHYFDSVILTRVIDSRRPFCEPFCFELPTVARNGAAADCSAIKVQLLNTVASGVVSVHQVELLPNLIDDPSLETGSGDPWIPDGWYLNMENTPFTAGDSVQAVSGHTGKCIQLNASATGAKHLPSSYSDYVFAGRYFGIGAWLKGNGSVSPSVRGHIGRGLQQASNAWNNLNGNTAAIWRLDADVVRFTSRYFMLDIYGVGANSVFIDDVYAVALDPVTLTVTPASLANSTEATGLRVDGRDVATQPATDLSATSGSLRWRWTPRHAAAAVALFGETTPYLLHAWGNATNYLALHWSAANTVRLAFNDGGGEHAGTWNATGAIVAGTTYDCELTYDGATVVFKVNGTARITLSEAHAFATVPTMTYWGHKQDGTCVGDATFAAPA